MRMLIKIWNKIVNDGPGRSDHPMMVNYYVSWVEYILVGLACLFLIAGVGVMFLHNDGIIWSTCVANFRNIIKELW